MGKRILYHATSVSNVESINEQGLKQFFEGIYLTDSADSAAKWIGFRLSAQGEDMVAVVEVEVDESNLSEGMDHSPMMQSLFGCGESILHSGDIPKDRILQWIYYGKQKKK
jgi:hypothetical protein